jgi:hypothetical protein
MNKIGLPYGASSHLPWYLEVLGLPKDFHFDQLGDLLTPASTYCANTPNPARAAMGAQQSSTSEGEPVPTPKTCYYELLGVERGADDEE